MRDILAALETLNLFIKSNKASATVITALGPLPSVKGTRERWFLMFPPFLNWKPELSNPFRGLNPGGVGGD